MPSTTLLRRVKKGFRTVEGLNYADIHFNLTVLQKNHWLIGEIISIELHCIFILNIYSYFECAHLKVLAFTIDTICDDLNEYKHINDG